jgi:hypothetical protein
MAASQTSGQAIEITAARVPRLLEHEPQRSDTPKSRGSTDKELWSAQLSWLLGASASALGVRGTMAAVIAAVERGGASGSSDFDHHTDSQIGGRWGVKADRPEREGDVSRHRRLSRQWSLVPLEHQRVLLAHYLGTARQIGALCQSDVAGAVVEGKFGELTGAVAFLWCRRQAERRVRSQQGERVTRQRTAAVLRLELQRLEEALWIARLTAKERPDDGEGLARVAMLIVLGKVVAYGLARVQAADALLAQESDQRADMQRLVDACQKGEPLHLRTGAEKAVRAGHRAWYEAGVEIEARELAR